MAEAYPAAYIEELEDGDEWLDKIKDTNWDMVISDLTMPDRGGLDSLCRISQDFPRMPVLILSLYPKERYAARALKAGASGYISKAAAPEELIGAVRKVLAGEKC